MSHQAYKPHRAKRLAAIAKQLLAERKFEGCARFASRAMDYDQLGVLDNHYAVLRADAMHELGNNRPGIALRVYNDACLLADAGRFSEAKNYYLESFRQDPKLIWPLNNLAWQLATSPKSDIRDGLRARDYSQIACQLSSWGCWAFITTLAAANAECGAFGRAVRLQSQAAAMAPPGNEADIESQLACYRSKRAYVDRGARVAAGVEPTREESQALQ